MLRDNQNSKQELDSAVAQLMIALTSVRQAYGKVANCTVEGTSLLHADIPDLLRGGLSRVHSSDRPDRYPDHHVG